MSISQLLRQLPGKTAALLLAFLVVGSTSAVAQDVIYVDTGGDDALQGETPEFVGTTGPVRTIARALALADDGDIISIEAGTYDEGAVATVLDNVTFEARATSSFMRVIIEDGIQFGAAGDAANVTFRANTVAGYNDGVFVLDDQGATWAADFIEGTVTVSDAVTGGRVRISADADVRRNDEAVVAGDLTYLGLSDIFYTDLNGDNTDITAGGELPDVLTGILDVEIGDNTLTIPTQVTLGTQIDVALDSDVDGDVLIVNNALVTGPGNVGSLTITDGTTTVTSAASVDNVDIANSDDITFDLGGNVLEVLGSFDRDGGTFIGTNGTLNFRGDTADASFEAGPNFVVGTVTVDKDGQTLTVGEDLIVTAGDPLAPGTVTAFSIANNTTVDIGPEAISVTGPGRVDIDGTFASEEQGGIIFRDNAADGVFAGSGQVSNILVSLAAATETITVNETPTFTGTLTLSRGGINVAAGAELQFADNAELVVNLAQVPAAGAIQGAFDGVTAEARYDLTYIGTLTANVTAGTEFDADEIDNVDFTFDAGANFLTVPTGGTIAGDVFVDDDATVFFQNAITLRGDLFVDEEADDLGDLQFGADFTLAGEGTTATVEGRFRPTAPGFEIIIGADNVTIVGVADETANASEIGPVTVGAGFDATVSGVQRVLGDVVLNSNATLDLGLTNEQAVTGGITLNGTDLTLTSNVNVTNLVDANGGTLNLGTFNLTANGGLDGESDVTYAGDGILILPTAATLGTSGVSIPRVRTVNAEIDLTSNTVIGTLLDDAGTGFIDLNESNITVNGNVSSDGGLFVDDTDATTANTVSLGASTVTLAANATIDAGTTVQNDRTVTIASTTTTARTLTVDDRLTVDGTLAIGQNDVVVTGNLVNATGTITAAPAGDVVLVGGDVEVNGNELSIPNLVVSQAAAVGPGSNGTLRITGNLVLDAVLDEADTNDNIVFGDLATITVNMNGQLVDDPTFAGAINLVYNTASTTGEELPNGGAVNNLTVNAELTTDQDVTINGALTLDADFNTTGDDVTLTEGSTLVVQDGFDITDVDTDTDLTAAGAYNLRLEGGVDDGVVDELNLTNEVFLGTVTTFTVALLDEDDQVNLTTDRTVTNLVIAQGELDLEDENLSVLEDVTLDLSEGDLIATQPGGTLVFDGTADGTFTVEDMAYVVPTNVNIVLNKDADDATVTLMGNNVDFATNQKNVVLTQGVFETMGGAAFVLFQNDQTQGFTRATEGGVIAGAIQKRVAAGDPFGAGRSARFEFPSGDTLGTYRPAAITFRTSLPTATNITVDHSTDSPGGTVGLPVESGGVTIGGYPDFYWLIEASTSLGPAQEFDLELTGTEPFVFPFEDEENLRIIRRFDGLANENPYVVQGSPDDYSNLISVVSGDTTVVVRAITTQGGLVPQGALFTLGFPTRAPIVAVRDAQGDLVDLAETDTTFTVDEGDTLTVRLLGDALDVNESVSFELGPDAPDYVSLTGAAGDSITLFIAPGFDDAGLDSFTVVASDFETGTTDIRDSTAVTIRVDVQNVNRPADIAGIPAEPVDVTVDSTFSFVVSAADLDADSVGFELVPDTIQGLSITQLSDSTAEVSFSPVFEQIGDTLSAQIRAIDAAGDTTLSAVFTLNVVSGLGAGDVVAPIGVITADDAQAAFNAIFNPGALSAAQRAAADVDGDGVITAYDAYLILRRAIQGICLPGETPSNDPDGCTAAPGKSLAFSGDLAWGEVTVAEGIATLPIRLADAQGVNAVTVTLPLAEGMSVEGLTTTLPQGWSANYAVVDGELVIGFFGLESAPAGELAQLKLRATSESLPLLSGTALLNGTAQPLDAVAAAELPEEFTLQGNYPNPFNPSTTISFDLPATAQVSVEVVNLLGQRVMVVPAAQFEAGASRKVNLDASELASGTYLYRVIAKTNESTLVQTGKMTLVK